MRFRYGDDHIQFELRRQPERAGGRLAIHVEPDGRVLVDAGPSVLTNDVLAAVKRRAAWIDRQLARFRAHRAHALAPEYVSGESVLFLGRRYRLRVRVVPGSPPTVRLRGGFLDVETAGPDQERVRSALREWYRQRAEEVFARRLAAMVQQLHWLRDAPPVRLRFMTRQWGSCSPSGRLTLNPWLVRAPREAIDYVLLHELCHLRHHDHGRAFHGLLRRHMPDWRRIKSDLDARSEEFLRA